MNVPEQNPRNAIYHRAIYHRGVDVFYTQPGAGESRHCVVCGTLCNVERDAAGPTSMASAISGQITMHDKHICPHVQHPLHEAAFRYWEYAKDLPVGRVRTLADRDLQDAVQRLHDALLEEEQTP